MKSLGIVLAIATVVAVPTTGGGAAPGTRTRPVSKRANVSTSTELLRRSAPPDRATLRRPRFARTNVLVKFKRDVSAAGRSAAVAQHGATIRERVRGTAFWLAEVRDPEKARKALARDPRVASVELNYIRHALATPNDPRFATDQQYLLPLRLPAAWDVSRGSAGVKVAIVDTGVDLDHPDLAPRLLPGYDFVNADAVAQDDEGHGTMVAGIAAAETNNGIGIACSAASASSSAGSAFTAAACTAASFTAGASAPAGPAWAAAAAGVPRSPRGR